jgi:hypothetical protein
MGDYRDIPIPTNFKYPERCSVNWNVEHQKKEWRQYLRCSWWGVPELVPAADAAEDAKDRAIDMLRKKVDVLEVERDEALEKLAELDREPDRYDHNDNILSAITAGWIIPNYYEQENFAEMEGWDQNHLGQFQHYLNRVVCCRHDFVRPGMEEVLEDFLAESE